MSNTPGASGFDAICEPHNVLEEACVARIGEQQGECRLAIPSRAAKALEVFLH